MTTVRTRKPSTAAWANIASSIVYQPLSGLVKSFTHGNGLTTTNTHSLDYELARCQVKDGTLSLIDKSYTRADKLNIEFRFRLRARRDRGITDAVTAGNSQSLSLALAEADGTTGVALREYIWLPGAGYAGTDLPVGVVDAAGSASPELLYVHADHLSRPIRLTDGAKATAWAVEWLPWGGVHAKTGPDTLDARLALVARYRMTANGSRPARERSRRARSERATQNIRLALQLAPALRSDHRPLHAARPLGLRRRAERVCVCGECTGRGG